MSKTKSDNIVETINRIESARSSKNKGFFRIFLSFFGNFKASYYITGLILVFLIGLFLGYLANDKLATPITIDTQNPKQYWMLLERSKNKEYLYFGIPGNHTKSELIKVFNVKVGVPGQRPTPLPQLLGKNYWKIVKKYPSKDNPETAPYFLELDVPIEDIFFGPVPYNECSGQCSWELPGYFGLHGVNGDMAKLSNSDSGSSGCIRHKDEDITYLYNLLNVDEGIRYYIKS